MCNLYSITTNQAAIAALFRVMNWYVGNLPPMPGVFPDYPAPVVRNDRGERELIIMRWGMPPPPRAGGFPVTNIRNTTSPDWRGRLKPESRCLVPSNSFAEHAPERTGGTKRRMSSGLRSMMIARYSRSLVSGPNLKVILAPSRSRSPALTWSTAS
jgi:putative SOS response-associated peptidase YedK